MSLETLTNVLGIILIPLLFFAIYSLMTTFKK